jgi:predicted ATPase
MVASAVAGAIGLGEQQGRSAQHTVLAWAADRQALFVLDNCEHLVDGVALFVEELLARSLGLVALATSRARRWLGCLRWAWTGSRPAWPTGCSC